jgi:hypothetical protein
MGYPPDWARIDYVEKGKCDVPEWMEELGRGIWGDGKKKFKEFPGWVPAHYDENGQ